MPSPRAASARGSARSASGAAAAPRASEEGGDTQVHGVDVRSIALERLSASRVGEARKQLLVRIGPVGDRVELHAARLRPALLLESADELPLADAARGVLAVGQEHDGVDPRGVRSLLDEADPGGGG